ncbi:glycosyltransferase, partial [Escherichia coli]|uniref:glycosyltransferase n=5 Tax=Pseudomonadota TaxID=1224 RepID=UPI0013CF6E30
KNLDRLAAAHAASGTALPLVVVGPQVPGEARLEATLRACPALIRVPWVPRAELLGMMRRARALLFPSLAEGFGLPIVEAMALG